MLRRLTYVIAPPFIRAWIALYLTIASTAGYLLPVWCHNLTAPLCQSGADRLIFSIPWWRHWLPENILTRRGQAASHRGTDQQFGARVLGTY